MKQEFKIKENGFSEISKPIILKAGIILFIMLLLGLGIKSNGFSKEPDTLLIAAPILIAIFSLISFFVFRRVKKQFESFRLIITDTAIIKVQHYLKKISIPINAIDSIFKNEKGVITIQGKNHLPQEKIIIPKQIEDFEKLTNILSEISPIKMK